MSINNSYPLSSMQQGMLLQSLHESGTYTQQVVCDLLEDVNETLLRQAWQEVAARHDILRTAFRWEGIAEPLQDVYDEVEMPWRNEDWSPLPPEQQQQQLNDFLLTDRKSSFDVTNAPLMRCVCFKLDVARYRVVWTFHHALLDGRSHFIVLQEVFSLYDAWLTGTVPAVPPRRSYGDYIYWLQQQQWSEHFWREYLRGFKPAPDLRIGDGDLFQKQPNRPRQPASLTSLLPEDLTGALTVTARKNEITVNTIVQASWALLLSRYYGSQDIVFGATRACRSISRSMSRSRSRAA